jgi:hypothetical protein
VARIADWFQPNRPAGRRLRLRRRTSEGSGAGGSGFGLKETRGVSLIAWPLISNRSLFSATRDAELPRRQLALPRLCVGARIRLTLEDPPTPCSGIRERTQRGHGGGSSFFLPKRPTASPSSGQISAVRSVWWRRGSEGEIAAGVACVGLVS